MAQLSASPARYQFGPFYLDLERRRILRNDRVVSWRSSRHFDILRVLIEAEPDVVLYETLRERVWNGKEIEPQTIAQTVKNLRDYIGAYADCIRNQPGQGYYFDRSPSGRLERGNEPLELITLLRVANEEWNRRTGPSLLRGLDLFRRSVQLAPSCVDGYLGIAACITTGCQAGFGVLGRRDLTEARRAIDRALGFATSDQHLAMALCQRAQIRMLYDWDLKGAEELLHQALRLDHTQSSIHQHLGHLYLITNRWYAVMDAIMDARRMLPASPMLHSTAGLLLHYMRRRDEAIAMCEEAVAVHPEFVPGLVMLGFSYEAAGRYGSAIQAYQAALSIEHNVTAVAAIGHAYAVSGKRGEARAMLKELRALSKNRFVSKYFFALVYAGLGDVDRSLAHLEGAYRERCDWLLHAGVEPRWDNLRKTYRFRRLMKKIGLPNLLASGLVAKTKPCKT